MSSGLHALLSGQASRPYNKTMACNDHLSLYATVSHPSICWALVCLLNND